MSPTTPEPVSTLSLDGYTRDGDRFRLEVDGVTATTASFRDVRLPTLTARTYHASNARDPDHWTLRDLQVELVGVIITNVESRPGYTHVIGCGILSEVRRFEPGHPPHLELSDEPCYRCSKTHPWSEGFLPPVDETAPTGFEVRFDLRTHTPAEDEE